MKTENRRVLLAEINGLVGLIEGTSTSIEKLLGSRVEGEIPLRSFVDLASVAFSPRLPLREVTKIRDFILVYTDSLLDCEEELKKGCPSTNWEPLPFDFKYESSGS